MERSDKAMLASLRNFFRKYVLKNFALKMVALAVAVLMWWVVGRDPTIEIPMTVPLEFHHAPDNLDMNSDGPLQAQITMRGPERLLRKIAPSEVHAVIDVQGAVPGERNDDVAVGEGGPHDRRGEPFLAHGAHQALLTGYLVPAVIPVRIDERGRFGQKIMAAEGLLIGARGTDEDVLARVFPEEA